jgi:hypothetical protein
MSAGFRPDSSREQIRRSWWIWPNVACVLKSAQKAGPSLQSRSPPPPLELVCGDIFWCNRHCKTNSVDLERFWGQVWPKSCQNMCVVLGFLAPRIPDSRLPKSAQKAGPSLQNRRSPFPPPPPFPSRHPCRLQLAVSGREQVRPSLRRGP